MKYILPGIFFVIIGSLVYKYLLAEDDTLAYKTNLEKQTNNFTVPIDSAERMWQRAKTYLDKNSSLISGGSLQVNDSLIYLPYYNDHKKGNSIRIEKHSTPRADSVSFFIQWWYSQRPEIKGSKAIALFMRQNLDKSDFK